jgi:ribosomal protein S8E
MVTYGLNHENKEKEKNTIQQILHKNKFDTSLADKFTHTPHKREEQPIRDKKWAKLTYIGKETKYITKLFKDSAIKTTFTTNNTITKILTIKSEPPKNQYDNSGIYQLTCPDCQMKYIGQTGSPFKIRYAEYFRDFKYNSNKSKFAQHLLEHKHSTGPIDMIR